MQTVTQRSARLRPWTLALGGSVAAIAAATATPAAAQCTPDPTVVNGTTTCTGTDTNGITVSTAQTRLIVANQATVLAGSAPAAILSTATSSSISVLGRVDGASKPGILITPGPATTGPCDPYAGATVSYCAPGSTQTSFPSAAVDVSVAKGGVVTGSQALLAQLPAGNTSSFVTVSLSNAGTLTGTAGPAVVANLGDTGRLTVSNAVGGSIGGLSGAISLVSNTGTIDGGANAAIAASGAQGYGNTSNTGLIVSRSTAATLSTASSTSYLSVTNSGTIRNDGTGAALQSGGALSLTNATGGTIGSNGTAITAAGAITLTNAGTINGSVVSTAAAGSSSTIDTRSGTINGNVALGAGDDTLRVQYDVATGRVGSISGTIDGGAGFDTLAYSVAGNTTLSAVALPRNFERLGLDLSNNAAVTLAPGFATSGGLALSGTGSVINTATLTTTGPAITANSTYGLTFLNQGAITATLANTSTFAVATPAIVTNTGSITALGGSGVQAYSKVTNSGTITAAGTGASTFSGSLVNSGTIRSTGAVAATINDQSNASQSTNSGSIIGATTGVTISNGTLVNSGAITGGTSSVTLGYSGILSNAVGGILNGAVANAGQGARVLNAGTINGAVNFVPGTQYDSSNDLFIDNGGTVNGAIRLGAGDDQLVVNLNTASGRPLAGATGGVDAGAGYDTLRYRVNANASAALALPIGFEALAFELDNKAALTLTAQAPLTSAIGLTGNGTVTLNGAISTSNRTLIDATIATTDLLSGFGGGSTQALSITNLGTLSLAAGSSYNSSIIAAVDAGTASFTNAGTIAVTNAAGSYYPAYGIFHGGSVTNSGTISMVGGTAIYIAYAVVNTGTISDTAGSGGSGVLSVRTLDNRGTIRVDQTAVSGVFGRSTIVNSGTIQSRLSTGVLLDYSTLLINEATGTISGATQAVSMNDATVINRGTIIGDVSAAASSYGSALFIADGGTVSGNVLFGIGYGSDFFLQIGASNGVAGTVDGGVGSTDTYGYSLDRSGSISLDPNARIINFENRFVQTVGADTVATLTGSTPFTGLVQVKGDGTVVNRATLSGGVQALSYSPFSFIPESANRLSTFDNEGKITGGFTGPVNSFINAGSVTGTAGGYAVASFGNTGAVTLENRGTISGGVALDTSSGSGSITVNNSGTLSDTDTSFSTGLQLQLGTGSATVTNSGTISATTTGTGNAAAIALLLSGAGAPNAAASVVNTGTISATGTSRAAISAQDVALTLVNTGIIDGGIALSDRADSITNRGTITGSVMLGGGDDTFIHRATATLNGVVDGGAGTDSFVLDATGNGSIAGSQLVNFERFTQTGAGTVGYSGSFGVDTIGLQGGTLLVGTGQTLATTGTTTITGGDTAVTIGNAGTIAGGVALGSGNDIVVNTGRIAGAVRLGAGDDSYTEGVGSVAVGGVDGGAGTDLYRVALAGDRSGIGARTNFEQLVVDGSGTLALTLDQSFQLIALNGPSLSLALGGFTVGRIDGSAASEKVSVDGDVALVALGGGDDTLALGTTTAAGRYDGGTGTDTLRFTATTPVTLSGVATGFETIALAGPAFTVTGILGSAGAPLAFGDGDQSLTVARGGTLAGVIDLGAGNDSFRLAAGGTLIGTVAGGAGIDSATLELAADATLAPTTLTGFERLALQGGKTLTLAGGAFAFDDVASDGNLTVGPDATLATPRLAFGAGDNRLASAGNFSGSVDGGTGNDSIDVSGGTAAFGTIANVETLRVSGGLATISGTANLNSIGLSGGRLIGLAGSSIVAPTITVGSAATFGSAGTVTGNIVVAGTLSPGASPGTMMVNGNVALAAGSLSLFEITPAVSDKLVVNGTITIANGATLQLVTTQAIAPGKSLDLLVASGGITGSYSTILKPASLFGFLVQQSDRISLLGQFLIDQGFTPQVQGSIAYLNTVLVNGQASTALLAAVPQLVTASGSSNVAAFARITPEAYASAQQIGVENGLTLADAGRSDSFASHRETPGAFTFGSAVSGIRTLGADTARGIATAQTAGYGFLGGLGWGSADWSIGAFGGYLDSRQHLDTLDARTTANGLVAGVHARWSGGGFGVKATVAYDGGDAVTNRAVPGGSAAGRYDLHGWTGDLSLDYAIPLGSSWMVRPTLGGTLIRSTRGRVIETGASPFALDVARRRQDAAFVDGAVTFSRVTTTTARVKPYLTVGLRYQVDGRAPTARASLTGSGSGLLADGALRAPVVATAMLGGELLLSKSTTLFGGVSAESGDADQRAAARVGVKVAF
ncbi:autotransporter outer membrane beta-barrel domain-containing protein [Sphingomonas sp. UYP23]